MRGDRRARWGLVVLTLLALAGLAGPVLAPFDPGDRDGSALLASPSADHWLGTDEEGRDLLSLLLHGARTALLVGWGTVLVSAAAGTALGLISGLAGGRVDLVVQRGVEIAMAFPGVLLAILMIFVAGRPGTGSVVLALALTGWAGYARLVRGLALPLRTRGYVEAARLLGLGTPRWLVRHVLPAVSGPVLVLMTFQVGTAILAEAGLSFLGLGPQDGASWGSLLEQGAVLFLKAPLLGVAPGLAIALTVLGATLVGDALHDRLSAPGASKEGSP